MMQRGLSVLPAIVLLTGTLAAEAENTGTDPANRYAWGENVGWVSAGPTNCEVTVHFDGDSGWLSAHAWGENIGWISVGAVAGGPYANTTSSNWGVNLAANGDLSGYAWGENVGWINFGGAQCDAAISPATGEFSGHAWGENIGWLKFKGTSPDYGVRTLAFDTQAQGTPNWWLAHQGVSEGYDAGDGVVAWRKYVMDTDPNVAGDYLHITAVSNTPAGTHVTFIPASTRRYYTLKRRADLVAGPVTGAWHGVAGQMAVQYGPGTEKTMWDSSTNVVPRMFYTVEVSVEP